MILHCNYNSVIRPRGDLLYEKTPYFELEKAFMCTDEEFCDRFGIDPEELAKKKNQRKRKHDEERDILWTYVHNV